MKIQYASDLHLEFGANTTYLRNHPLIPLGDILILAGDIGYLDDEMYLNHPFWDWASGNFERVIVIPGNHELYKSFDINKLHNGWSLKIRDNINCVYNEIIALDNDTDLIATTLWSNIKPEDTFCIEKTFSDFHMIRNGEYRLSWERFNEEHCRCRRFLEENLSISKARNIIVTSHHVPSSELMAEEYIGSSKKGAFSVELGSLIANSRINYWIYGHSHRNINKIIGSTHCVSNQMGYVALGEHKSFQPDVIIEI